MKKVIKVFIAALLSAVMALSECAACFAEPSGEALTVEEKLEERIRTTLCSFYSHRKETSYTVSQPFPIYSDNGSGTGRYLVVIFSGKKADSFMELCIEDGEARLHTFGSFKFEAITNACANGEKVALLRTKGENLILVSDGVIETLDMYSNKPVKVSVPDNIELEEVQLIDLDIPEDTFAKKWEEELIYYSKYKKHKDEEFFEDSMVRIGGPMEWWLSWEEADLFRNAEDKVIQLRYEDFEVEERPAVFGTEVSINLYLGYNRYYTYKIDISERFTASIPEILKETGLAEDEKYKDIIGVIIESPSSLDVGSMSGRFMNGYEFLSAGWFVSGESVYYIGKDLKLATGSYMVGDIRYTFDDNGVWLGTYTGWTKISDKYRYWKNGILMRYRVFEADGKRYRADGDGYAEPFPEET